MVVRSDASDPWRFELIEGPTARRAHFREKFKQLGTDAGMCLTQRPDDVTPLAFWIDRLFKHCKIHHPEFIHTEHIDSGGGSLVSLCEASATYCAWFDRHLIERSGMNREDALTAAVKDAIEELQTQESVRQQTLPIQPNPEPHVPITAKEPTPEPLHVQLEALRIEARMTHEDLAGELGIDPTNVSRHMSGKSRPRLKTLGGYQRVFSKVLERKVLIYETQGKRS